MVQVLFYSLAILLAPIAAFIVSKGALGGNIISAIYFSRCDLICWILSGVLGLETHSCNIWSAVIAVIVLHLMLGLYIYRTFYPAPTKQTKQD